MFDVGDPAAVYAIAIYSGQLCCLRLHRQLHRQCSLIEGMAPAPHQGKSVLGYRTREGPRLDWLRPRLDSDCCFGLNDEPG